MAGTKKELKLRIKSVKSTQKITKAMKMVAAAKLRRARLQLESALPYANEMKKILSNLAGDHSNENNDFPLLVGRESSKTHLIIVASSDRGLCGSFNSSIAKATRRLSDTLENQGKIVKILCLGRKGYEQLKPYLNSKIIEKIDGIVKNQINYKDAENISKKVLSYFENGAFDSCSIIFNKFKSAISQEVTNLPLIPLVLQDDNINLNSNAQYEYEPNEKNILNMLLPKNIAVQIYYALLENAASEQGARMSAMDNATSSASEMIKNLSLIYNRTRQADITRELIEIISGAEAM